MRVLGIDPGLRITGYGCIVHAGERSEIVEAGVIRLVAAGSERRTVSERLMELDADFRGLLDRVEPEIVAVEGLFAHYKHPATAIAMGHARGVLLLAIRQRGVRLMELKPLEVKRSVTGHGHAKKEQMQRAVQTLFGLSEPPTPHDVADALAIALAAGRRASSAMLA
ncbi:MAG: crossover junction endodeoxyribonuclease RuvC [Phycisphaeraceae bacterium]|nr:crossover junction endodeoxyribonuclease RuvC [Phycisphaeraceae bacterium]